MSFPITPNDIFAQTNGGLDIILRYYPQAEPAVQRKNYKFRIRDEKSDPSPSAVLAAYNGVYKVKDFGTGDRPMDAIAVVMREERLEFWDAVKQIVSDCQLIMPDNDNRPLNRPEIRKRDAEPGEEEGYTWVKKEFTKRELQSVFGHGTWIYLSKKRNSKHDVFGDELAMVNALEICEKYNFISLASYKKVKDGKVTITSSTETFPIFMFDEGTWQKFYKPMEQNQSYRFFSIGKKPEHYVFGLKQAEERLKKIRKEEPDEDIDSEGDKGDKKEGDEKLDKLNEIIMCTGGSDALNVAAFGYEVVWFNSETVKPQNVPYLKLRSMAYTVYNLPDVDASGIAAGRELGLTYLDIHTIWLPEELKRFGSGKGKPCKDVRDYLSLYSSEDFRNLIKLALMFRFWDEEPKKDRSGKIQYKFNRIQYEYKPNNRRLYNFLYHSGFGKLAMPNAKDGEVLVQLKDNVVTLVQFRDVRKYIEQFLEERYASEDLFNSFYKSDQVSDSSLQNLKTLSIDFKACDWDYQMLFFQNETWKITKGGIEVIPVANTRQKVWSDKVIPHRVKKHKEPPFVITRKRGTGAYQTGDLDIQFNHTDCLFTRYLIQTSRMYWRQELEERLPGHKQEYQLEYMKKYAYSLEGELLTEEEIAEQKQHFIAKLCSIGYLLHRHKEPAQAYCVWGMDYTMTVGQSYGGTGKSICYDSLKHLMRQVALQGRDEKLTDRQFLFSGVTEHTDYIYVDDAHQYFNFSYFYSIITGQMEAERKGLDKWVLDFSKSPKLCITSNFTLRETDSATMRRVWYTCFSDYYHKNPNGEYLQDRSPKDELGKTLFADFDPADWNNYLNFVAGCIQSWMEWGKIEPPMQTVKENTYKSKMGATFHSWADVFFAADSGNLNAYVQRTHAFDLFKREYDPKCTAQSFLSKLDYWCKFNHYVLNPRELWTDKRANRITRREFKKEFKNGQWVISEDKAVIECLYIQTPDVPLQEPVKESPKPELPAADGFNKPTGKDIPF